MDNTPNVLPGRCSEISVQKKNRDRVSIFVEDSFVGGFHYGAVEEAGIQKGSVITPECYDKLVSGDRKFQLRDQIYRWLGMRNHSAGELRRKALAKGYSEEEIIPAIETAELKGYIDDISFARQFTVEKRDKRNWGPVKIHAALADKGIKKHYIEAVLDKEFDEDRLWDGIWAASRSMKNRLMKTEDGIKQKKKLVDHLIRRGFPPHQVLNKADDLLKRLEHEKT